METDDYKNNNINTVKEMILDEEKLVTYITLSKDLCMHVNNSKKLLSSVIDAIREEDPNVKLSVSFIISGLLSDNTANTKICTEEDLEKIKQSLSNVFFYHVYSICKGSPGIEPAAYLMLNKYEDFSLCTGIIKSEECTKRSSDEIGNLKNSSQEVVILENKPGLFKKVKQEQKPVPEPASDCQMETLKPMKQVDIKSEVKIKTEIISPKKETSCNQIIQKSNGVKTQKRIASFFTTPNSLQNKSNSNGIKYKDEKMDINNENSDLGINIKQDLIDVKLKEDLNHKEETKGDKKDVKREETDKILSKIKKSSKVDKKRKRVLHISDSESDDEEDPFAHNQDSYNASDDEIPPTPSANNEIKITLGITNPKKRRKTVDKTYTHEDGYILTKKVEVYESCSDNENEVKNTVKDIKVKIETPPKAKKNSPKKSKKKVSPIQKGKQPTLNSFFKKK